MSCIGPKLLPVILTKYEHRIGFIVVDANQQFKKFAEANIDSQCNDYNTLMI